MTLDPDLLAAERAIDEARCGRPLLVDGTGRAALYLPLETAASEAADLLRATATDGLSLVISAQRANALGIADATDAMVLAVPAGASLQDALALVTPRETSAGSGRRAVPPAQHADMLDRAFVALLKCAWLLPAALRASPDAGAAGRLAALVEGRVLHRVSADALARLPEHTESGVTKVSEARIPLADAADARFVCFRSALASREHLAVVIGDPPAGPGVPVRLHSACLTGDVFGSLRCDCGDQLRQSVVCLAELGGGVLLYLSQEGRGIGLANKLRAYALQDGGRDTIDADLQLGFAADERHYEVAAAMLGTLGYDRIRLLTNNPDKLEALRRGGVTVIERLPLIACITPQNRRYMDAKRTRARHLLDPVDEADA